jgi:hypothetical protein
MSPVQALPRLPLWPLAESFPPGVYVPICACRLAWMVSWVRPDRIFQEQGILRLQNPLTRRPWLGTFPTVVVGVGKSLTT